MTLMKAGKNRNKVLLLNPPLFFDNGEPKSLDISVPPLGLMYLASYINKFSKLFEADIIDISVEKLTLAQLKKEIDRNNLFAVGIYAMTPQLQGALELAKNLKKFLFPRTKIFLGGPHISADPKFVIRFKDVFDYAICGEAEKTFLESLTKLLKGGKINKIQIGDPIEDLDELPILDRQLIKREKYAKQESMMFSRGCPYNCYYCSRPAIDRKVRYRSVGNIIDEIKLYCTGINKKIDFQDDSFTLDRKKVIGFCQQVVKERLDIIWTCNTRIDLVDEELLKNMSRAGCDLIHFGIESGNEKVRREIVKKGNFSNSEIKMVFSLCHKVGIKVGGYFMIGHPGETKEDLEDTKKLIFDSKIDLLGLSIPTPFPGSKLFDIAKERGVINEEIMDKFAQKKLGVGYSGVYPVLISENMSKAYVYSMMKGINRKFYLNFHTLAGKLKKDLFSPEKIIQDAGDMFSLIKKGVSNRKPYVEIKKGKVQV